ncbi:MAG: hypothetical protein A2X42_01015 [Candidatus Margulisbacteria bacterium GWF2_38_17]|nr:MAG: hypothetical protein A2X42_01015 [Candidatus Margulisbacteria bacterium GWF2_38_17]OGI11097.1 MAG: hypothetical protein A2X41_02310 [Candidatus Margulisbacteria bacterium GWE2_39_32]
MIGIVDILFTLIDLFINNGVPFLVVLRLLIYKIPAIMVLFFPMATLFSVMLTLIRMAKDNEITVLRASGVNVLRIILPFIVMAVFFSFLSFAINEKLVPWTNHVSNNLIRKAVLKTPPPDVAENIFFRESGDRYFYVKKIDSKNNRMLNILIYELLSSYPRVITAQEARWNMKTWKLINGKVHKYGDDGVIKYEADFAEMEIHVDRDVESFFTEQKTPKEMGSDELRQQIGTLDKGGINTNSLKIELSMKKSIPAASLSFAIIGMSLCILFVSSSKDWWGVIFSVLIALLAVGFYFFLMATFRSLGRAGEVPLFLGAWTPNLLFSTLGLGAIFYKAYSR